MLREIKCGANSLTTVVYLVGLVRIYVRVFLVGHPSFWPGTSRWLMKPGRDNEATRVLEYLHHTKYDYTSALAYGEAKQIKAQVEAEKNIPGGSLHILRTPLHCKCAFFFFFFGILP